MDEKFSISETFLHLTVYRIVLLSKYSLEPDLNLLLLFERVRSIITLFLCSSFKVQVA